MERLALAAGRRELDDSEPILNGLRSPKLRREDLMLLKDLVETQRLRPVIDRRYPLEQIPEARTYVERGHKKGNVVITIAQSRDTCPNQT